MRGLTFDRAVAAAADHAADLSDKDWGAVDVFNKFLIDDGNLSQVPVIDASNIHRIQPNTLVRFRGMVQDMFGNELYIGAYTDGLTWKTNKYTDFTSSSIPPASATRLWERRLLHCIPVPGQNSWTLEPFLYQVPSMENNAPSQNGEKRGREVLEQDEGMSSSCNKKQVICST